MTDYHAKLKSEYYSTVAETLRASEQKHKGGFPFRKLEDKLYKKTITTGEYLKLKNYISKFNYV